MKTTVLSALVISAFSGSVALATTSSIDSTVNQTKAINVGLKNTDYKASWNDQTSSVTTRKLADLNGTPADWSATDGLSHLKVNFTTNEKNDTSFMLAPDAGYGGAINLDRKQIASNTSELWWGFNWNNTSQILTAIVTNLRASNHTFEGYWVEGCATVGRV